MTHYTDSNAYGNIEVVNNIFGAGVDIPTNFFKSGIVNAYEGYFGKCSGLDFAAFNVGPTPTAPLSMNLKGLSKFDGVHVQVGGLCVTGWSVVEGGGFISFSTSSEFFGNVFNVTSGQDNSFTAAGQNVFTAPATSINSQITSISGGPVFVDGLGADLASSINSKKPFDITHPTKQGWRLRHVCIEGPTADVYVRGILRDQNIIELPEYWINLVDAETITVNLTPIGSHQELFVDKIEWGTKIHIKNNSGSGVNCYYTVYGERKDTSKNIPEYEGTTIHDYPGDNSEYLLFDQIYNKR